MFLLDTTAISEARASTPSSRVARFLELQPPDLLFTSVVVIGELLHGAERHPDSRRRSGLRAWVHESLVPEFGERILPISREVAEHWGTLAGAARPQGTTLPVIDSLIAATALIHGLTVVTRNAADFERCGAAVHNPWAG